MESAVKNSKDLKAAEERWRSKVIVPKGGKIVHRFKQVTASENPTVLHCMRCGCVVCVATATLGRILRKLVKITEEASVLVNNEVVETFEEKYIPKFTKGYVCPDCFKVLWDDIYVTKQGDIRRGITVIHEDSDHV